MDSWIELMSQSPTFFIALVLFVSLMVGSFLNVSYLSFTHYGWERCIGA